MQVTLTSHGEELLKEQLSRNVGSSAEEILERALETLTKKQPEPQVRQMTPAEAVADILELRKGVTLGGLKIKDLIHEGHKYSRAACEFQGSSSQVSYVLTGIESITYLPIYLFTFCQRKVPVRGARNRWSGPFSGRYRSQHLTLQLPRTALP